MTRLGYLLPFLCALGWGANADTTREPFIITSTTVPSQVATTENKVSTSVNPSSPIVPTSKATTPVAESPPTTTTATKTTTATTVTVSPPLSAVTTKPTPTVASTQGAIQPATVKTDTKAVGVTSSGPMLSTVKDNALSATSPNDNSVQPTDLANVSTTVSNNNVVAVTSQPNITEYTTKPATKLTATSLSVTRTSEQSIGKVTTNNRSTVSWFSTVSPSLVTAPKSTAGSISDSAKSLGEETIPTTIPSMDFDIDNITVSCKAEHDGSKVKFNINPSKNCVDYATMYKDNAKEILKHICTAVKPGYQPKTDKCHVDLGSQRPDHLVILNAYVQNSPSADALYASLKHLKKDGSDLFQYDAKKYEEEDLISIPLISGIVSVAVALLIASAIYGCCHQRQARKREQRLTEELQTMENGYHDNPTLEVMETSPEMQEKKGGPNGDLGDSWIVPLDNLTREDLDEEEDTHL